MVNYNLGKIYLIRSHQTDKVYVGSTCQKLCQRFSKHKYIHRHKISNTSSFEVLKFDDAYIELYQFFPCENKEQLHKKEGEIIRMINCVNKRIAGRTKKIYYQENRERLIKYYEKYYINNREEINKKRNKKKICECGCKIAKRGIFRHKKTNKHKLLMEEKNKNKSLNHFEDDKIKNIE